MFIILPSLRSIICFATNCDIMKGPTKSTSITCLKSDTAIEIAGSRLIIPALFIRI